MRRHRYITFSECLWIAATHVAEDDDGSSLSILSPQAERQMWAIQEGLRRTEALPNSEHRWQSVKARKKHECIRGCKINRGDIYFREDYIAAYSTGPVLCAGCMALVLYYQQVYNIPVVFRSHWDLEQQEPVLIEQVP